MTTIRWGILSTGGIANKMADAVRQVDGAELLAVGSRTQESADAFGAKHGIPRCYATYEALAADPDLDVIYVATPHPWHVSNSVLALENGKAVICEKPLTMDAAEARTMIDAARANQRFLMEAMWTRFMPSVVKLRELIAEGVIGEPRLVQADLGFRAEYDFTSRLFAPELGGGALLDVGIYPLSFVSMVLGTPSRVHSVANMAPTGVDETFSAVLHYGGGAMATVTGSLRLNTPLEADICGTEGRIRMERKFYGSDVLTVIREGQEPETITVPTAANGFVYEVEEVNRCLRAGWLESPVMPLAESLAIMGTLDAIKAAWSADLP
jgi:predicted dehydrogenase